MLVYFHDLFFFNLLALSSQSVYVVSPLPPTTTMKRFLTIIPWIPSHRLKHGRIDGIRTFQKPAVFEAYQGQQGLPKRGGKAFTTCQNLDPPHPCAPHQGSQLWILPGSPSDLSCCLQTFVLLSVWNCLGCSSNPILIWFEFIPQGPSSFQLTGLFLSSSPHWVPTFSNSYCFYNLCNNILCIYPCIDYSLCSRVYIK